MEAEYKYTNNQLTAVIKTLPWEKKPTGTTPTTTGKQQTTKLSNLTVC